MDKKNTYAGRISNAPSQYVASIFKQEKAPKGIVHKGNDLRCGKGGNK